MSDDCCGLDLTVAPLVLALDCDSLSLCLGFSLSTGGGSAVGAFVSLTSDTTISEAANGVRYNNTGAIAQVVATLPPAVVGLYYYFRVSAAQLFTVAADGTDTIDTDGSFSAAALEMDTVGAVLDLECHDDGVWTVVNVRLPWAPPETP